MQYETVLLGLQDPDTIIHGIFQRALDRITAMAMDLGIAADDFAGQSTVHFAMQAAQILLIMRPVSELPSDYQDYTLVALLAVAANLSAHQLGTDAGIQALALKFNQTPSDLKSVFHHILGELAEYRSSVLQIREMEGDGALPLGPTHLHGAGGYAPELSSAAKHTQFDAQHGMHMIGAGGEHVRQVDVFASELEAIVGLDAASAAIKAGLHPGDLGADFEVALNWGRQLENLPASRTGDVKSFMEAAQHSAQLTKAIALLDMAHKWKIDAVQHKYQDHMESVRSRAQTSIDSINQRYKADKAQLEATLLVAQGQEQSPRQQMSPFLAAAAAMPTMTLGNLAMD